VRLVVRNVLGSRNGSMDASCLANPAKLSFCFAEDDPPDPWLPLRVELGYAREDTIVFALATEASRQIANINRRDPESLIRTFASAMGTPFTYAVGKHMQGILVIGPDHVRRLVARRGPSPVRPCAQNWLCVRRSPRVRSRRPASRSSTALGTLSIPRHEALLPPSPSRTICSS
jgi:hypothetical protein